MVTVYVLRITSCIVVLSQMAPGSQILWSFSFNTSQFCVIDKGFCYENLCEKSNDNGSHQGGFKNNYPWETF